MVIALPSKFNLLKYQPVHPSQMPTKLLSRIQQRIVSLPLLVKGSACRIVIHNFSIFPAAALAVNIVVPILVLILVAALLYAAFKHGLIHRLLVNCSGRRADAMMIDDDDDSPLS